MCDTVTLYQPILSFRHFILFWENPMSLYFILVKPMSVYHFLTKLEPLYFAPKMPPFKFSEPGVIVTIRGIEVL